MARVLAFINRKGGSAKTTSAVNVAARLANKLQSQNKRILLIDLDPQGHAATALGVNTEGRCISYFLTGDRTIRETLVSADRASSNGPSRPNLILVPSTDRLRDATRELEIRDFAYRASNRREKRSTIDTILSDRFAPIRNYFEYIIIDCPPSLGPLDIATYDFVDEALVPVKMAYLDTAGAKQHLDDILEAQELGADIKIGMVIPTFYRAQEILARQVLKRLTNLYGSLVSEPIPQSVIVEKSQAAGQKTLFEYAPESKPTKAYDAIVERIMHNGR